MPRPLACEPRPEQGNRPVGLGHLGACMFGRSGLFVRITRPWLFCAWARIPRHGAGQDVVVRLERAQLVPEE